MGRIKLIAPRIRSIDTRTAPPPAKVKDAIYYSDEFKAWRTAVMERAGGRCQAPGCGATARYADHVVELRDGGAPFDLTNGQALCPSHHQLKTAQARAARVRR